MSATPDSTLANPEQLIADLQRQLAELRQSCECKAERDEALEQQTATAEVLQVINSSPGDLAPVFDAMLEKAMRLCERGLRPACTYDGAKFRAVALHGVPAAFVEVTEPRPRVPGPGNPIRRGMLAGERVVHIADLGRGGLSRRRSRCGAPRSISAASAPSLSVRACARTTRCSAFMTLYRQEVRPFTDKQIALLQNFAAQAVIAMENARLLTETREALEQQTATAEVLQVINSSPGDLAPVFEAILEKAHALCGASRGTLFLYDGKVFSAVASHGYPGGLGGYSLDLPERRRAITASEYPRFGALLAGERLIHVPDLAQLDDPIARTVAEHGGVRTNLLLPLRKDDALLGVLSCNRPEVRPFTDKQIALLQNFAAQAVIAMENARLAWRIAAAHRRDRGVEPRVWRRGSPNRSRNWGGSDG